MTTPEVSVIIPSLDEVENLQVILPLLDDSYEIIVVEGRDLEATRQAVHAIRPDATVITQTRKGKGNALVCGIDAATGDYVILLDADGSADPAEIGRFVDVLRQGADMAKGTRYARGGGSVDLTWLRSSGNVGLTLVTNILFGKNFTDLCYGYNAFRRDAIPRMGLPSVDGDEHQWGDGFEIESMFTCRAARVGLDIVEVPSYEFHRIHGRSNLHAWEDGKRVLRTILHERFLVRLKPSQSKEKVCTSTS